MIVRWGVMVLASVVGFHVRSVAQNLVPNPSFELANRKPKGEENGIGRAKDWIPPIANSDYYMKGTGRHSGTPRNVFGYQKPRTGDSYAGICVRTNFLEYLEAKLIDTLIKDQEYLVELYLSRAERSLGSVKEFGVLFTEKKIWGMTTLGIAQKPDIIFNDAKKLRSKKKWMKLSGVYKARGEEAYLIIGHFNYNTSRKKRFISHYYVEDVSVIPIKISDDSSAKQEDARSANLEAFIPKVDEPVILEHVYFNTNMSELLAESFLELDKLASYLITNPDKLIRILGHTDNSGNETQNMILSETRAKAVAEYLSSKGVSRKRITFSGQGSSSPISSNDSDEGKKRNRRVEFIIINRK